MASASKTLKDTSRLAACAGVLATGLMATQPVHAQGQPRYDAVTQTLLVPTLDVDGQIYRELRVRQESDGRLTLVSLTSPTTADTATRAAAAAATAQSGSNACAAIRPFYWEIGDKAQRLASGSVRGGLVNYDENTLMNIASASKWIYGAYVAERRAGVLTDEDVLFLNFRSGYDSFDACQSGDTVASCVASGSNGKLTPAWVGQFSYGGGHMQKHASLPAPGMNLGTMDNTALASEIRRVLGADINISYSQPQLAGGIRTTARDYAVFLRKLLNNQLQLAGLLGAQPVCTAPSRCAAGAINTPVPAGTYWHYSLGHWVEDDTLTGDGSFSSAGAFGFYPWIDAAKRNYGIVARVDVPGSGSDSAFCGAVIRAAWMSGVAR